MVQTGLFSTRIEIDEAGGLAEGLDTEKGELTLTVIRPGFNAAKRRFYPADTLRRDYKVFEGAKMFADHATPAEEKDRPEGSVRRWVGSIKQLWVEQDGTVKARAAVIEEDLKSKVRNLADHGLLGEMGVSIRAIGEAREADIGGLRTNRIERLLRGRSVDFVTYPGAGGCVELLESSCSDEQSTASEEEARMEEKITQLQEKLAAVQAEQEATKAQLDAAKTQLEATKSELAESRRREAESLQREKRAAARVEVSRLLAESKLPEAASARLAKQFEAAESAEGVAQAIQEELDYIARLQPPVKPGINVQLKGFGESAPASDRRINLTEAFKRLGLDERAAEFAARGSR